MYTPRQPPVTEPSLTYGRLAVSTHWTAWANMTYHVFTFSREYAITIVVFVLFFMTEFCMELRVAGAGMICGEPEL